MLRMMEDKPRCSPQVGRVWRRERNCIPTFFVASRVVWRMPSGFRPIAFCKSGSDTCSRGQSGVLPTGSTVLRQLPLPAGYWTKPRRDRQGGVASGRALSPRRLIIISIRARSRFTRKATDVVRRCDLSRCANRRHAQKERPPKRRSFQVASNAGSIKRPLAPCACAAFASRSRCPSSPNQLLEQWEVRPV